MTTNSNTSQLIDLIKGNKVSVGIGFVVAFVLMSMLLSGPIFSDTFNPIFFATETISFLLIWLITSYLVAKFSVYKVLAVFLLLISAFVTQEYLKLPYNNPISIPSLVLFWYGIAYLLHPDFIKKNKIIISSIYAAILLYFYVFRKAPNYQEFHLRIIGYFITISVSLTILFWLYKQLNWLINLKSYQTKTELAILKNQVSPHFFFNTLHNLYGLAIEKSDKTPEMILKLSEIMRYTIYKGTSDFVSLKEEVSYIEDYMDLHKIRYQKKVRINMKKDIDHPHKIAPILLVLPIENAFKHGVESLTENAFIDIAVSTSPTHIFFKIKNNYESSEKKDKGVGMENLKNRLGLIYPKKHQLKVTRTKSYYELYLSFKVT